MFKSKQQMSAVAGMFSSRCATDLMRHGIAHSQLVFCLPYNSWLVGLCRQVLLEQGHFCQPCCDHVLFSSGTDSSVLENIDAFLFFSGCVIFQGMRLCLCI